MKNREFDALMREATADGETSPKVLGPRVLGLLRDANQAHRDWADDMIERATAQGCWFLAKHWLRSHNSGAFRTADGRVLNKSRIGAMTRRDVETGKPLDEQQVLFFDMPWAELKDWISRNDRQIEGLKTGIDQARRMLALGAKYPESKNFAHACRLAGVDANAYLAGEAAA